MNPELPSYLALHHRVSFVSNVTPRTYLSLLGTVQEVAVVAMGVDGEVPNGRVSASGPVAVFKGHAPWR